MTRNKFDTVVIGGGLAGMVAAFTAKTPQNRVLLVSKGYGSCYYGPGVIDLLGNNPEDHGKLVSEPLQEISRLSGNHPYNKVEMQVIQHALSKFADSLESIGYPMECTGGNMLLPTAMGSIRPAYLVPPALANGKLNQGGNILLVGIEGFHYFSPGIAAKNLGKSMQRLGLEGKVAWCSAKLDFPKDRPVSAYDLALWFEQQGNLKNVAEQIIPYLGNADLVGLPAVLGLEQHALVFKELEKGLGKKVFEIPTIPPSIPGIRLYRSLMRLLFKKGVEILNGYPAVAVTSHGKLIKEVVVHNPGKPAALQAENYILAAGGLAGGGLSAGPGWVRETLFNLPVYHTPEVERWSRQNLLNPKGQPYASFGITVDAKMRPLDHQGELCFTNLYAAGSILAYCDLLAEKSSGGIDLATGFAAGMECRGEGIKHELPRGLSGRSLPKVQHL